MIPKMDVFSLGCTIIHLVTEKCPIHGHCVCNYMPIFSDSFAQQVNYLQMLNILYEATAKACLYLYSFEDECKIN